MTAAVLVCLVNLAAIARAETVTVTTTADSGPGSLRAVVAATGGGDTIDFDAGLDGQTIDLTSGPITIERSLTIAGPGASQLTIDAGHASRIFALTNGSLSISGLTLANGAAAEEGGAIYTQSSGTLTVSDCTFTGNTAGGAGGSAEESNLGHGGAIYVSGSSGATSVTGSTFTGNAAGGDGGTGFQSGLGSGGAIWDGNPGSLTVTDSTFTANTAGGGGDGGKQSGNGAGGAIQKSGGTSLIVSGSEFTANTAGGDGGSESASGRGHGGAIYVSQPTSTPTSLTVTDSSFTENAAGGAGGDGPVSGVGEGGAIEYFSEGALSVSGTRFEGNSAGGAGGTGGVNPLYPAVAGSGSGEGGAIAATESASSTSISNSSFSANTAGGDGGSGTFSGRGDGGAIADLTGDAFTVSDSTFSGNATGGAAGGGSGSGRGAGGAIKARGGGSLRVVDSTFAANAVSAAAGGSGGAINMSNKSLSVSGSTFVANTVGEAGGGGSGGAIEAGAIPSLRESASISDSTLVGNAAGGGGSVGRGGALDVADMFSATLASVTIDDNSVGQGGSGAGIAAVSGISPETAIVTAKATIVSGNTGATNCDAPVASTSYSLEGPTSGDTSCGFDLPSADPRLQLLADNGGPTETQAIPASSPADDAVPAGSCPTTVDQRGEPRPDNGKGVCDVGAYELQDPPVAPQITSAPAATFQVGKGASFTIAATGLPRPALSEVGTLPGGLSFTDDGDGTARISGTPPAGAGGGYPITIRASNGILPDAEQRFLLTVEEPPSASIAVPAEGATFVQGQAVTTSFTCAEGRGGPGIASCAAGDGRHSGAPLDTATVGRHTFDAIAASGDGLTGKDEVTYTVAPAAGSGGVVRIPAGLRIVHLRTRAVRAGLRVTLTGVISKQAQGKIKVRAVLRMAGHGRRRATTRWVRIADGRWHARLLVARPRLGSRARLSVTARFAGTARVEAGSASRRIMLGNRSRHSRARP